MSKVADAATTPAGEVLLTVRQLAIMLQISPQTLARMRRAGRLPAPVRRGRAVRWRLDDVTRWLDGGRIAAADD